MKTLTLFRACIKTQQEFWVARREIRLCEESPEDKRWYENMVTKRERQFMKLQVALTKCLQEQEKDLAWWRERSLMWTKKAVDLEMVRREIAERCHQARPHNKKEKTSE